MRDSGANDLSDSRVAVTTLCDPHSQICSATWLKCRQGLFLQAAHREMKREEGREMCSSTRSTTFLSDQEGTDVLHANTRISTMIPM